MADETTGHTLFLDTDTWDVTLDSGGNIATASGPYAIAQNVANAVRLFTKDAYYDPDRGIPHFSIELGHKQGQLGVLRSRIIRNVTRLEGVDSAEVSFYGIRNRELTGNISLTMTSGETGDVAF